MLPPAVPLLLHVPPTAKAAQKPADEGAWAQRWASWDTEQAEKGRKQIWEAEKNQDTWVIKNTGQGLPGWLSGKESVCQGRRHGLDPWVRKMPWKRKWQPTSIKKKKKLLCNNGSVDPSRALSFKLLPGRAVEGSAYRGRNGWNTFQNSKYTEDYSKVGATCPSRGTSPKAEDVLGFPACRCHLFLSFEPTEDFICIFYVEFITVPFVFGFPLLFRCFWRPEASWEQRPFPIYLSNFYRDRCVNNYKGVLSVQTEVSRGGRLEESHSVWRVREDIWEVTWTWVKFSSCQTWPNKKEGSGGQVKLKGWARARPGRAQKDFK